MTTSIVPLHLASKKVAVKDFGDFGKVRITPDGDISVYDLIETCAEYKGQDTRYVYWKRLKETYPTSLQFCKDFKFQGKGQRKTPVCSKQAALEIMGLLPGVIGDRYRKAAAALVAEYLESPEKLAARAIDRVENPDDLEVIRQQVKYKQSYHGVHGELQKHGAEDVHHATLNKYNNGLIGIENGQRQQMDTRTRALLTGVQALQEVVLMDKEKTSAWGAVNTAKKTGSDVVKAIAPSQEQ